MSKTVKGLNNPLKNYIGDVITSNGGTIKTGPLIMDNEVYMINNNSLNFVETISNGGWSTGVFLQDNDGSNNIDGDCLAGIGFHGTQEGFSHLYVGYGPYPWNIYSTGIYIDNSSVKVNGNLVSDTIGNLAELQTENKDSLIGAINELFQSANNGKELIASAIGEPLSSEDTFSAMSDDINGLLATFKTNMMNNGITVESSDKFKSLIDKIATMVENGQGKGIQYEEKVLDDINYSTLSGSTETITITTDIKPTIVFVAIPEGKFTIENSNFTLPIFSNFRSSSTSFQWMGYSAGITCSIDNVQNNSFNINFETRVATGSFSIKGVTYYAIGVGEEDTTLRDSLASILTEEGVSVTEEDDMASLISKVDEEFTKDNNTISEMETNAENTRSTLAGLMTEGGYDITGDEDIDSLLELLVLSGISVSDIKQIVCGDYHTFILKNDDSLWACGDNDYGQLGLDDTTDRTTFTQVSNDISDDIKQIVCGSNHTIILKNDGSVWACGSNSRGQLGLGTSDYSAHSTFTQVTTNINNDVSQISGGSNHTIILKNDGNLWCCGYNNRGQLGLGDTTDRTTFTQITTNISNDVSQISGGGYHTIILKNDGSLWCCGRNNYGQLGLNDTTDRTTFTQVSNDVKQIACGGYYTYILKNDGSLWACGNNYNGELGLNDTTDRSTFTQVTANINNDVKQIACGWAYTFIIKNDGSVWACGSNSYGQLGLNDITDRTTFTNIPRGF